MNEIHPSLQIDLSLLPKLLHREPKCFRGSFMIRSPLFSLRFRKECLVEILRQVPSIHVTHRPHRADHAPESAVLYRGGQVQTLVYDASFRHFGRVTSGQKCEFGNGQICAYDLEKRKALPP